MSSGKNRLMLMMALTLPGAAHALGLGDIHVDSALNEHLAAEIDIVGASALELADLRAAVANRETFLRYGVDRPAFLSSATFKVAQDAQGRPVLAVRSTESFTEPVVNFLVDLRWNRGELVRQYTLLLDPADFAARNRGAESVRAADSVAAASAPTGASAPAGAPTPDVPAAPPLGAPIAETRTQTMALQADPPAEQPEPGTERAVRTMTHVKVGAKATLRGIAWRVGERSEPDLQRMMLAIFRANPSAFDGNINRLYLGALLTIPSREEVAAISKAEAKREIHAQMDAWRAPTRAVASNHAGHLPIAAPSVAPDTDAAATAAALPSVSADATIAANAPVPASDASENEALNRRIQSLQHELGDAKGVLDSTNNQIAAMQEQAAREERVTPPAETAPAAIPLAAAAQAHVSAPAASLSSARPKSGQATVVPVVSGLGLLGAALAGLYFRFRRRMPTGGDARAASAAPAAEGAADKALESPAPVAPQAAAPAPMPAAAQTLAQNPAPSRPYDDSATDVYTLLESDSGDATVKLQVDAAKVRADSPRLDYNLVDLDQTAQHVHMPSALNEQVTMKERRTNLTDVLKLAIEREPDRHDLRMKLLELYYSAAAANRQGFLDVVQKFARERDQLESDQWEKIAFMGRQIASENPLFAVADAEDDLADCA